MQILICNSININMEWDCYRLHLSMSSSLQTQPITICTTRSRSTPLNNSPQNRVHQLALIPYVTTRIQTPQLHGVIIHVIDCKSLGAIYVPRIFHQSMHFSFFFGDQSINQCSLFLFITYYIVSLINIGGLYIQNIFLLWMQAMQSKQHYIGAFFLL